MTVVVTYCVNVTLSELQAGIEAGSIGFINASFNDTVQLSAYNLTYDPSVPLTSDKSGMVLEWRCKRSTEVWPAQLANQSYVPYHGTVVVVVVVLRALQRDGRCRMLWRCRSWYTWLCRGTVGPGHWHKLPGTSSQLWLSFHGDQRHQDSDGGRHCLRATASRTNHGIQVCYLLAQFM